MKKDKVGDIEEGNKILCKSCKTKKFRKCYGKNPNEDYGEIVYHKKGCKHLQKIIDISVER